MSFRRQSITPLFAAVLILAACAPSAQQVNNDGNAAFKNQNYDAALNAYQQAQQKDPDLPAPYYNAGNTYYRQNNYDQAQSQLLKSLTGDDGNLSQAARFNLGNVAYNKQNYQAAVDAYKEVLRSDPNDADAKHNLEMALNQLQQQQDQTPTPTPQDQNQQTQTPQPTPTAQDQNQQSTPTPQAQSQPSTPTPQDQQQTPTPQNNGQQDQTPTPQGQQNQNQTPTLQNQTGAQDQGQATAVPTGELSEQEARQLLEAVGGNTRTLQEQLQRTYVVPGATPAQDW